VKKEDKNIPKAGELEEIVKELKENPYHNFSNVFALMTVIPFLAFVYLIAVWLSTVDILAGRIGTILVISFAVSLSGFYLGRNILKKLISYAAELKNAGESRSSVLANVSHDLRSPITALMGYIEGLMQGFYGRINAKQKEVLSLCQHVVDRMSGLTADLLDHHKKEAGKMKVERTLCDLYKLVQQQAKEFEFMLHDKSIELSTEISDKGSAVWADESKITQVVNNLLSNAVKYTPEAGEIAVRVVPDEDFVKLEFVNNGDVIPEDKLEKIFDKFERADTGEEGTGLGLAIAKDIVDLHKGQIWAESDILEGNKFIVRLPRDLRKTCKLLEDDIR
jgi:signal transduction histidine kinase